MSTERKPQSSAMRTRRGVVIHSAMDKTVVVEVARRVTHAAYGKFVKQRVRYKAHDAEDACNVGDTVVLVQTRPLSKTKRWRVQSIAQKAVEA